MPQNQDFGFELASRLEAVAQHANEKKANCKLLIASQLD
jgi:S-adenosylmethionine:tRNA-ribosyltransferase-isomerase (queuine synthetase)